MQVTIKIVNTVSGVITCKDFKNKKEAKTWIDRSNRHNRINSLTNEYYTY